MNNEQIENKKRLIKVIEDKIARNEPKEFLDRFGVCPPGAEWLAKQKSYEQAWNDCYRGDWMLTIAQEAGVDLKILTKAKVECAKLVERLMTDERSINALRIAERFAEGKATLDELRVAAAGASDATADAFDAAAASDAPVYAYAASLAADAALAAADTESACTAATATTAATTDAAGTAAKIDAKAETLKKCADICRKYINFDAIATGLGL
jgi:hypothetical protein